jgi:hypothetical protein
MTLNLASQASNMREQDQLVSYLTQARKQLKTLVPQSSMTASKQPAQAAKNATSAAESTNDLAKNLETMKAPSDIPEVLDWLDRLIANAPKPTPLLTAQILDKPQR